MADYKVKFDPLVEKILEYFDLLQAAPAPTDPTIKQKYEDAIKILGKIEPDLKRLICGAGMGILIQSHDPAAKP